MCPASIYNYANTLHMLGRNDKAKKTLTTLIKAPSDALRVGCPGYENPNGFKLDAYFLMFLIVLDLTKSWSKSIKYANEHLKRRKKGLRSVFTKKNVLKRVDELKEIYKN